MNSFALADCSTVEAALSQLKDGAVVKAGGVDLLDRLKNGTDTPARLVNIRNISGIALEFKPTPTASPSAPSPRSPRWPTTRPSVRSTPFCPTPAGTPPRRTSATWQPSAEICCRSCSAGTSAPPISSACAKARTSVLPSPD